MSHKHIGTEHLLLGLLREEGGFAARLLRERGADLKAVRKELSTAPHAIARYPDRSTLGAFSAGYPSHSDSCPRISFEIYTEKARRSIFYARYEASVFGAESIEPEHLLLGMWREAPWVINGLMDLNDPWESLRKQIEEHSATGKRVSTSVDMPLSEESKRALMYAAEEAEGLRLRNIEIEHLLLGLLREEGCFAAQLLRDRGANLASIRKKLAASVPPDLEDFNPT